MSISVTPAIADDAALLSELHGRCFEHGWPQDECFRLFESSNIYACLAREQEKAIGFILLSIAADQADMLSIATLPEYRRQGVALQLLTHAMTVLAEQGVTSIHLEVASDNVAAIALYTTCGFEKTGMRKEYYRLPDGTRQDALQMRCDV